MNTETVSMTIIAYSGDARTLAFQALNAAKSGNYEEADRLMKESDENIVKAHQAQTDLLVAEANDEKIEINVLLIHSQDHLMTSMAVRELIKEIIELHKTKADK